MIISFQVYNVWKIARTIMELLNSFSSISIYIYSLLIRMKLENFDHKNIMRKK